MNALGSKRQSAMGGCLFLVAVAAGFVLLLVLGADQLCAYDIARRLPDYPGVSRERSFLRAHALGRSETVLFTGDDPELVREWFRELNLELLAQDRLRGLATINRWSEPAADGNGTIIHYISECGL